MNDDLNTLKKGYREIQAPPQLATRIRANVHARPPRLHSWIPAGATVAAVIIGVWLLPYTGEPPAETPDVPGKPSLTALAALKPDAPPGTSVSLSQLKTMKKPKLPAKPTLKATKPQTNLESENDLLKEKDYVLI